MVWTEYLPDFTFDTGMVISVVTWFFVFIIILIIAGVVTFIIVRNRKFNRSIVIFEKIGGRFEPTKKDRAMAVKFGQTGDTVLYLRKHKKYVPTPQIQTGRNTFWYAVRSDGEWINIGLEDIDLKMKQAKAHFLDKEMRYARVALQRNLRERYDQPSFLSKYGGLIAYTALILVTGIMVWLIFDKFIEVTSAIAQNLDAAKDVSAETRQIIGALDNLKSSGGLRPA